MLWFPFWDYIIVGALFGMGVLVAPHAAEGIGSVVGNTWKMINVNNVVG